MSADPFASQQEIYELRSSLDRANTRIDELLEERKQLIWWRDYWRHRAVSRRALIRRFIRDAREKRLA